MVLPAGRPCDPPDLFAAAESHFRFAAAERHFRARFARVPSKPTHYSATFNDHKADQQLDTGLPSGWSGGGGGVLLIVRAKGRGRRSSQFGVRNDTAAIRTPASAMKLPVSMFAILSVT